MLRSLHTARNSGQAQGQAPFVARLPPSLALSAQRLTRHAELLVAHARTAAAHPRQNNSP